jgi:UDP-N-acetylmuramoyl-L-alanyl-D-glutamate--2,6-diaminopimelate ligase
MDMQAKWLSELGLRASGGGDVQITDLTLDSRSVRPGALFAALPGAQTHGARFIGTALREGAGAVLTDIAGADLAQEALAETTAALVITEDPRAALAMAAALWFGGQPETMVAVTGTNGKTSVASFCRQIWVHAGLEAVNIGTTGIEGAYTAPSAHTTPDTITLHKRLADMAAKGITHAAMEASSHGLDQRRLDGVHLRAAGFTNFTQDHLDYHGSFEAYFAAKHGLFSRVLPQGGTAVLNLNDSAVAQVAAPARARGQHVIGVGHTPQADIQIKGAQYHPAGQILLFSVFDRVHRVDLPLIGGFQAENVMMALGLCLVAGLPADEAVAALPHLQTVRGRMQWAATRDNGAAVYVDYAHTPDALEKALNALRPHVLGRLIVVFGAGGDRDRAKRPLMGQAAARAADLVFVTDDNPRSEEPGDIRAQVLAGCPAATEVGDRAEAILRAADALQAGDVLLIAGKGHETGQTVGDTVYPFDDVEQASVAVAALEGRLA